MLKLTKKPLIVAIVGKGGTGKTIITTLITKVLTTYYNFKLLLIDGDPTFPHLSRMVKVIPRKNLEMIKSKLIQNIQTGPNNVIKTAETIDFEVYDALIETPRFSLISIGQPEESGCFCPSNAIMKKVLESISKDFEIVLIDCEAGLEQINRMVLESVDIVIVVSDESKRSIETAKAIKNIAMKFTHYKKIGLIINRITRDLSIISKEIQNSNFSLISVIPEDNTIKDYDLQGKPMIDLPEETASLKIVRESLIPFLIL